MYLFQFQNVIVPIAKYICPTWKLYLYKLQKLAKSSSLKTEWGCRSCWNSWCIWDSEAIQRISLQSEAIQTWKEFSLHNYLEVVFQIKVWNLKHSTQSIQINYGNILSFNIRKIFCTSILYLSEDQSDLLLLIYWASKIIQNFNPCMFFSFRSIFMHVNQSPWHTPL